MTLCPTVISKVLGHICRALPLVLVLTQTNGRIDMIGKGRLVFNSTTPSKGDEVAAYIFGDNRITSTDVDGDEGLDVNVLNDLNCDLDGVYNVSTNADPDNVGLIGHVRNATPGDTHQTLRWTGAAPSSDSVDPANLQAMDVNGFDMGWDTDHWDRIHATAGAKHVYIDDVNSSAEFPIVGDVADDTADSGNPIKIGWRATNAALTELSAANDRADGISDIYRRQMVNNAPNVGISGAVVAVDETGPDQLDGTKQSGRLWVILQNQSSDPAFIGGSGVTATGATKGFELPGGATEQLPLGEFVDVYAICASGETANVQITQVG